MKKLLFFVSVVLVSALCLSVYFYSKVQLSATAKIIKKDIDAVPLIACEDALWLLSANMAFINEKFEQMGDENKELSPEEYANIKTVFSEPTPTQLELEKWQDGVKAAIREKTKNPEPYIESIGNELVSIYYTAAMVNTGIINKETAENSIKEPFCGTH